MCAPGGDMAASAWDRKAGEAAALHREGWTVYPVGALEASAHLPSVWSEGRVEGLHLWVLGSSQSPPTLGTPGGLGLEVPINQAGGGGAGLVKTRNVAWGSLPQPSGGSSGLIIVGG